MDITTIDSQGCKTIPSDPKDEFHRDLLKSGVVVRKDTYSQTVGSYLGFIWLVLDPLVLTLVYLFVFTIISHREDSAAIFVSLGVIRGLQRALMVSSSPMSLKAQRGFPIERVRTRVLVMSNTTIVGLDSFFMGIGIAGVLTLVLDKSLAGAMIFIVVLFLNNLWWHSVGLMALNVTYVIPDFHKLLSYFGMGMFFVSPVLYSFSLTSGLHRTLLYFNPATYFIEFSRYITGSEHSMGLLPIEGFIVVGISGLMLLWAGNWRLDKIRWNMSNRS